MGIVPVFVNSGCHNKIAQTGQLKQWKFIFHSSGGWESKVRVPADFVSSERLPLACRRPPARGKDRALFCLTRAIVLLGQDSTFVTLFNLNYPLKGTVSNTVQWRTGASTQEFSGGTTKPLAALSYFPSSVRRICSDVPSDIGNSCLSGS